MPFEPFDTFRSPQIDPPPFRSMEELGLRELEQLRLVLRGDSVVDWRHLNFTSRSQIDDFLRLHLLDHEDPNDRAQMRRLLKEAVDYLRSTYHYRLADAVAEPYEIQDLFLYASGRHPRRVGLFQKIACIILKVVHVIHHMEGRELLFRTPIAPSVLARMVDERIMQTFAEMKKQGLPIVEVSGSIKTQHSLITKLIAKRDTVAAQVYDKIRYRVITRERDDVVLVLDYLMRTLFPFTLIVPSQTENSLIDFEKLVAGNDHLRTFGHKLHMPIKAGQRDVSQTMNPFSGRSYRVLNFVVDMPARIDAFLPADDPRPDRPRTVFSWVEFQMMDLATATENERGENSHERYKARQLEKVLSRLSKGLVVPKGRSVMKPWEEDDQGRGEGGLF
ncbi:MAG: TIGR04552 family protein [Myxococcales bacterium]|nr:TIGR04552 family protein [Myxococcales bacterium]